MPFFPSLSRALYADDGALVGVDGDPMGLVTTLVYSGDRLAAVTEVSEPIHCLAGDWPNLPAGGAAASWS